MARKVYLIGTLFPSWPSATGPASPIQGLKPLLADLLPAIAR